jgi:hypothetical protein
MVAAEKIRNPYVSLLYVDLQQPDQVEQLWRKVEQGYEEVQMIKEEMERLRNAKKGPKCTIQ